MTDAQYELEAESVAFRKVTISGEHHDTFNCPYAKMAGVLGSQNAIATIHAPYIATTASRPRRASVPIQKGRRNLIQPAMKCRGREYLRTIYSPQNTAPENLTSARRTCDASPRLVKRFIQTLIKQGGRSCARFCASIGLFSNGQWHGSLRDENFDSTNKINALVQSIEWG